MPRHSPYALCNLNLLFSFALSFAISFYRYLVACFLPPFGGKIAVSYLFSWKDQFLSFSIAFSISVRLLYSVFNDHLHTLTTLASFAAATFCAFAFGEMKSVSRLQAKLAQQSVAKPALLSGRSGWIRTIDLALIRRAL